MTDEIKKLPEETMNEISGGGDFPFYSNCLYNSGCRYPYGSSECYDCDLYKRNHNN